MIHFYSNKTTSIKKFVQNPLEICIFEFNTLPNNKILDKSKVKLFAYNKERCGSKIKIYFREDRKHCLKKRKCRLSAFASVPTVLIEAFF